MIERMRHRINPEQIISANAIHDHYMPGWRASDAALEAWAARVSGWDEVSCLAKAAVVNDLYYARHDRLVAAAEVICKVMADAHGDPVAIVEQIARVKRGEVIWEYVSFASKFVHWFVAPEAAPIYDAWAVEALRHHHGRLKWAGRSTYRAYAEYVFGLREASGLDCSIREMDRYLWMSGMYRAWVAAEDRGKVGLSGEVRGLFESANPSVQHALRTLVMTDEERESGRQTCP
jgi:hypothetical protein